MTIQRSTSCDEITSEEVASGVRALMPDIIEDLKCLIRHPSVAFPDYSEEPVITMADATVAVLGNTVFLMPTL